jgi:hypothetical protein
LRRPTSLRHQQTTNLRTTSFRRWGDASALFACVRIRIQLGDQLLLKLDRLDHVIYAT